MQFPNGENALQQLSSEDLCIIHLTKLDYPDESISWMLGYAYYSKSFIDSRRREIRSIMRKAGIKESDVTILFP